MPLFLALDFGGTKLAAALVDSASGRILGHDRQASPGDAWRSIDEMVEMAHRALANARCGPGDAAGIGISFGGPVDQDRRHVRLSHHVPGWEGIPLVSEISARLGLPATMDNDANTQCLGEWRFGAGRGAVDLLFVNVGTGIGGGLILGGYLHRGRHGLAGEIGHTVVLPDGPVCTCGKRGCVEALAAGPGIARAAREALARLAPDAGFPSSWSSGRGVPPRPTRPGERLVELAGGEPGVVTAELVFRAAGEGDPLAVGVVTSAGRWLGLGIANAAIIVDPELIVVGGGVAKAGELFLGPVREGARAHAAPLDSGDLRIVPGQLGDDANVLGAAVLAEGEPRRP